MTTYTTLLHKLNSIHQTHGKLTKDYYKHVVQIRVKPQECHRYIFRPGDLECQAKEAFFKGLQPEFQSMVVHKRDHPSVSITQLFIAIRECKENQENNQHSQQVEYDKAYPPFTTRNDNYCNRDHQNTQSGMMLQNPGQNHYQQDNRNTPVTVQAMHLSQVLNE